MVLFTFITFFAAIGRDLLDSAKIKFNFMIQKMFKI